MAKPTPPDDETPRLGTTISWHPGSAWLRFPLSRPHYPWTYGRIINSSPFFEPPTMSGFINEYCIELTHFLSRPPTMLGFPPRQTDISRILDPSYSPNSRSINHSQMAYVDAHGLLHDPDYRDFPTLIPHTAKRSHLHSTRAATTPSHTLSAVAYHASRPPWDRSDYLKDPLSDLDDAFQPSDDEDDDDCCGSCDSRSCCSRSRRSSLHYPQHNIHHLFHRYHLHDPRRSFTPTHVHSNPEKSPPTFEKTTRSRRFATETIFEADDFLDDNGKTHSRHPEWTPTCSAVMRRQWQAASLRLSFSLFRATRRMHRCIEESGAPP